MDRYVFVGTRWPVLERMLDLGLNIVKIYIKENPILINELTKRHIEYEVISSKKELVHNLHILDYEYLISNGCPYILPISELSDNRRRFINLHPSLLPQLKGANPINAAFLFHCEYGVTCHYMDDGIDTGKIIAQKKLSLTEGVDLGLLYQLVFMAEADVFEMAYKRNYECDSALINRKDDKDLIYYTRKEKDMIITFNESISELISKIKAFGVPSLGSYFKNDGQTYKVMDVVELQNPYVNELLQRFQNGQIIIRYDNSCVIKIQNRALLLKGICSDNGLDGLHVGKSLF